MFRNFFRRKKQVTLLNDNWEIISPLLEVNEIPKTGDYIYLEELGYFKVLNVVHYILKKQGIFIVLEKINKENEK